MNNLQYTIIKYSGILVEDNANSLAVGIYKNCFDNGELVTKTCNDYIDQRINIHNKYKSLDKFNYTNFDSFFNELISWFRKNHQELFNNDRAKTFETTIRNAALKYFNSIS